MDSQYVRNERLDDQINMLVMCVGGELERSQIPLAMSLERNSSGMPEDGINIFYGD